AVLENNTLYITLRSDWNWSGKLQFDLPRHKAYFHLPSDYPRINQFPEWFTVEADQVYTIFVEGVDQEPQKGGELLKGLPVHSKAGVPVHIIVSKQES
ncbi:MAG: hypothetical protein ACP5I1_04990, partial [Candidatus Hinthialibacter sp.]